MLAHFMLWEQIIRPSLKAMRPLVIRPLQGFGNTASLSYPDTWVGKPNCLHLPYSPTTKELKKKHSFRLVGGVETQLGQRRPMARQWLADLAIPHLRVDELGGTTGERLTPRNLRFQCRGNKASKPLTEKTCGS